MLNIKIRYVGLVRNIFGKKEEAIDLPKQATVLDLLSILAERHGDDFRASVFSAGGNLQPLARVLLDGVDIEEIGGLNAVVRCGEQVSIVVLEHPFAGG